MYHYPSSLSQFNLNVSKRNHDESIEPVASIPNSTSTTEIQSTGSLQSNSTSTTEVQSTGSLQSNSTLYNITTISIIGGSVLSLVLPLGHHLFLSSLHGRNIDNYSQFWIKNASNGFANVFSVCMAFTATSALLQTKWAITGKHAMSVETLDTLFALPKPTALLGVLLHPSRPLVLPILASILIQALVIVSVLAPNALTTTTSDPVPREITVPTLDLSKGEVTSIDMSSGPFYTNLTSSWTGLMASIMLNPPAINWHTPGGCGAACSFEFRYQAPSLDCRNTGPDEYRLHPGDMMELDHRWIYEANSTLYPSPSIDSNRWDIDALYDFSINYAILSGGNPLHSRTGGGAYCHFRNATYKASFNLTNNVQTVNTSIESYGPILGNNTDCTWEGPPGAGHACWTNGVNTRAMCDAFATGFQGRIGYSTSTVPHSSLLTSQVGNMALVQTLFKYTTYFGPPFGTFDIHVPDLAKALVDTFSNLTLGLIPHRSERVLVQAMVWDGESMWFYTVWILWAVYAPALLLALPIVANGLWCVWLDGPMDDCFSAFLLATRNVRLGPGDVHPKAQGAAALPLLKLRYRGEDGTFGVEEVGDP